MKARSLIRDWLEFIIAFAVLKGLGMLPRSWALTAGCVIGQLTGHVWRRLRRVGRRNLELAFPDMSQAERDRVLRGAFRNLGRLLGEFSQFPKLTPANVSEIVEYDGLEHYQQASAQARGVLILTAHIGAWELSSFAHALFGYPMYVLARRLDNPRLDRLIERYRRSSGVLVVNKTDSVRHVLQALRRGATVGILLDLNTQPHEGIFCDFFGRPACTSPIMAMLARRTGAPVVPGYLIWDEQRKKHRLHFEPPVPLQTTDDAQRDIQLNTTRFNQVIEQIIRRHPDQWLWVHKRWHTRPTGEPDLYQ
ncbi:MAG: lysophospholipid acyltransferase family protein [Acidobacteriota bacterium]|nr:lysophospholipid acyltransferase family protein [Blastocatellia bacterium]MDW8238398.1 lysophospholipid acyltransferase family protein [Acidobacteriota bacterium]